MLFICFRCCISNAMCTPVAQWNHSMTSSHVVLHSIAEVSPFKSSKHSLPLESVGKRVDDNYEPIADIVYSFALAMNSKQCVTAAMAWLVCHASWPNTVLLMQAWSGGTFDCPLECFCIVEHNSDRLPIPWWQCHIQLPVTGVNSFQTPITQWNDHVLSLSDVPDPAVC